MKRKTLLALILCTTLSIVPLSADAACYKGSNTSCLSQNLAGQLRISTCRDTGKGSCSGSPMCSEVLGLDTFRSWCRELGIDSRIAGVCGYQTPALSAKNSSADTDSLTNTAKTAAAENTTAAVENTAAAPCPVQDTNCTAANVNAAENTAQAAAPNANTAENAAQTAAPNAAAATYTTQAAAPNAAEKSAQATAAVNAPQKADTSAPASLSGSESDLKTASDRANTDAASDKDCVRNTCTDNPCTYSSNGGKNCTDTDCTDNACDSSLSTDQGAAAAGKTANTSANANGSCSNSAKYYIVGNGAKGCNSSAKIIVKPVTSASDLSDVIGQLSSDCNAAKPQTGGQGKTNSRTAAPDTDAAAENNTKQDKKTPDGNTGADVTAPETNVSPDTNTKPDTGTKTDTKTDASTKTDTSTKADADTKTDKQGTTTTNQSEYVNRIVELVNAERAKQGLSPVTLDSRITQAAQIRANEIITSFSHTRPNGSSFASVLKEAGISYRGCGENIAWGQKSPEAVMDAWMNSEGHRANILNKNYKYIGVGYVQSRNGTKYWSQLFTY